MGTLNKFAPVEGAVYKDVVLDNTPEGIGTTPIAYAIEVDNSDNTAKSVLHVWDKATSAPAFGTDEPDWIYTIPAGERGVLPFPVNGLLGDQFTAIMWVAVTTGANVNVAPTNTVKGTVWTDGT